MSTSLTSTYLISLFDVAAAKRLLWILFPRIQTHLRSHFAKRKYETDSDLYQWFQVWSCYNALLLFDMMMLNTTFSIHLNKHYTTFIILIRDLNTAWVA